MLCLITSTAVQLLNEPAEQKSGPILCIRALAVSVLRQFQLKEK